jgi:acyl-CoA dehydrogenase
MDTLLTDSAAKIFADHCDKALLDAAERGEFPRALWRLIQDNGFDQILAPDSGVEPQDAFAVLKVAGAYALPLPLAETVIAQHLAAATPGLVSIGLLGADGVVRAPWATQADSVLAVDVDGNRFAVAGGKFTEDGTSMCGEPIGRASLGSSADLNWRSAGVPVFEWLALSRVVMSAGAMETVLQMSLDYVNEREQFGRSIARFQAVQHALAMLAAEVAAAVRAADAAVDALHDDRLPLEVAAAKSRVGEAAGTVAELAHQAHGAMGFTHEHRLHHFTRRLWAWRDEFGNESYWQQVLGRHIAGLGADEAWPFITSGA